MTNEQIVLEQSVELMKQGILACAGQINVIDADGNESKMDMPEVIHTYQEWHELGYQVKKGEHAVAKFAVWKPRKEKKKDGEPEDENVVTVKKQRFVMCNASWFKFSQVERLEQKEVI